ncbi:MAG: hypothetical protein JJE39_05095 [Vicinamibacteria bacterium]|nr:hypothetical protein [Vicinamibacteria bacterium]
MYVAMAEEPRVFTVSPWGYRILLPGLIGSFFPPRLIAPGFEWMARGSLIAASGLLFVYLRVRGARRRAAILAAAAVLATPPVSAVFANPFLVEPFALALLLFALIAIEGGATPWVVALSLAALSLSKEIWVLLLPVIFLREAPEGAKAAGLRTLGMAGPAIWIGLLMRGMWIPQGGSQRPGTDYLATLGSMGSSVAVFAPQFLLGGLSIVALVALYRPGARDYARRHVFTIAPLLVLPLFAAAYTGEGAATSFFADDVRRLLIYVLPFVAALAVFLDPGHDDQTEQLWGSPILQRLAIAFTVTLMLVPLGLDRYSRIDLSTSRDGPYVLGFVRETLKTGRKLSRGETVVFDPTQRKFAWGVSPPNELSKLRFFLRSGFGPQAHYGVDDIRMRATSATLIAPVLEARALNLTLTVDARESAWITVLAAGERIGEVLVGPQAVKATFEIPATNLRRGDNPIELRCEKAPTALPRLLGLELRQPLASR